MLFGPYEARDIEQIEERLRERSISYEVVADEEELEKGEREYQDTYPSYNPGFKYHVRSAYIEIADEDLKRLGHDFERFGIVAQNIEENYQPSHELKDEHLSKQSTFWSFAIKIFVAVILAAIILVFIIAND